MHEEDNEEPDPLVGGSLAERLFRVSPYLVEMLLLLHGWWVRGSSCFPQKGRMEGRPRAVRIWLLGGFRVSSEPGPLGRVAGG